MAALRTQPPIVSSRAYDNASSFGSGTGTVAQNDQDLGAEWGRSSFERRNAVNVDYAIELRSLAHGTGTYSRQYLRHAPAPDHVVTRLQAEGKKEG